MTIMIGRCTAGLSISRAIALRRVVDWTGFRGRGEVSVESALDRELDLVRRRAASVADSTVAELARCMARTLDDDDVPAAARVSAARVLADALDKLRELAPPIPDGDGVDDIARRRAKRRAAG